MANFTDGTYFITSAKDPSLYLEMQPDNVVKVIKKRDVIGQRWNLKAADTYNRETTYQLISQLTESILGVRRDGEKAFVAGGHPRVHWEISKRGQTYTIGLPNEDRIMAVGDGGLVIFTERTGEMDQRWNITPFVDPDSADDKKGGDKKDDTKDDKESDTKQDAPPIPTGNYIIRSARFPQLCFELQGDNTIRINWLSKPPIFSQQWHIDLDGKYGDLYKYYIHNVSFASGYQLALERKDKLLLAAQTSNTRWMVRKTGGDYKISVLARPPDDLVINVDTNYKPFLDNLSNRDIGQDWYIEVVTH